MWFDDYWHPDDTFRQQFHPDEFEALRNFNDYYEERLDKLPPTDDGLEAMHSNSTWLEIVEKASKTLKKYFRSRE